MRVTVTLNLGLLNNPWYDLSGREIAQHIARWLAQRPSLHSSSVDVMRVTQYDAPQISEPTAVITFQAFDFDRDAMHEAVHALACVTNQGCIAWRVDFNDEDREPTGGLTGPRAADYTSATALRRFKRLFRRPVAA